MSTGKLNSFEHEPDFNCRCRSCQSFLPIHQFYTKGKGRRDVICKSCVLKIKSTRRHEAKKIKKQSQDKLKRNRGTVLSIADYVLADTVGSIDSISLHKIVKEYVDRIARED